RQAHEGGGSLRLDDRPAIRARRGKARLLPGRAPALRSLQTAPSRRRAACAILTPRPSALSARTESFERQEIAPEQNAGANSDRKSLSTFAEFALALAPARGAFREGSLSERDARDRPQPP